MKDNNFFHKQTDKKRAKNG